MASDFPKKISPLNFKNKIEEENTIELNLRIPFKTYDWKLYKPKVYSQTLYGMCHWNLTVFTDCSDVTKGEKAMVIVIGCDPLKRNTSWSIDVTATYTLHARKNKEPEDFIIEGPEHTITAAKPYTTRGCIPWKSIYDGPYVCDGYFRFSAKLKIIQSQGVVMRFNSPVNNVINSDVTLIVGDKRIESNKAFLAMHSPFFDNLFRTEGNEHRQEYLVDSGESVLLTFLLLLHSSEYKCMEMLNIIALARRWQCPRVLNFCEDYLCDPSRLDFMCIARAEEHGLDILKEFCCERIKVKELRRLQKEAIFSQLSTQLKIKLCDAIIKAKQDEAKA